MYDVHETYSKPFFTLGLSLNIFFAEYFLRLEIFTLLRRSALMQAMDHVMNVFEQQCLPWDAEYSNHSEADPG